MRKIISILLSMLMIVSMCTFVSFGASAKEVTLPAEPTLEKLADTTGYTALSSESDFSGRSSKIAATGKYYLTADITLKATVDLEFEGELHGNGYTITVSAPLFKSLVGATISNLKIKGNVSVSGAEHVGLLAKTGDAVTVTNVITEGTVKNTSATSVTASAAGLIGMLSSENESTLTNCYNKAAVTGMNADPQGTAGIVGYVAAGQLNLVNCVNTGAINGYNDAAGIVCYAKAFVDAENCINAGTVVANDDAAGGILGHTTRGFDIDRCENMNTVSGKATAGIVANMNGCDSQDRSITNCTNSAAITGKTYVAGIVGYYNTAKSLYISNCVNTATITATEASGGAMGAAGICCYSASDVLIENCTNEGNAIVENNGTRQAAGVLGYANDSATIRGCVNTGNCTVSHGSTATMAAGMLAYVLKDNNPVILIEDCTNSGNMTAGQYAGGILAFVQGISNGVGPESIKILNCTNSGNISIDANTAHSSGGEAAGIVARISSNEGATNAIEIKYCVNTGNVNTNQKAKFAAAGIAGYVGTLNIQGQKDAWVHQSIVSCYNSGNVTGTTNAAGIVAGAYGSGGNRRGPQVIHCGSAGTITCTMAAEDAANTTGYACGILAYSNVTILELHDNFFVGTVSGDKAYPITVQGQTSLKDSGGAVADEIVKNYYVPNGSDTEVVAGVNGASGTVTSVTAASVPAEYKLTADDVTSGKLAYLMQEATGEDETVWGQTIGTDATPVLFGEKVAKVGDTYMNVYITDRNLSLAESFNYKIYAKTTADATVKFTLNGASTVVAGEATAKDGVYVYNFKSVAPQFMAADITSELVIDGDTVDSKTESILDYCESLYETTDDAELKTLVEKVFLYGAAARDYVVANELYTAEALPAVTSEVITATAGEVPAYEGTLISGEANGASFVSANVYFDSTNSIVLKIKLADGVDASKVTVNGKAVGEAVDGVCTVRFDDIYASAYADAAEYKLSVDGVEGQTLTYSVSIYAQRMANSTTASDAMKVLATATYEYGVAAAAYID